MWVFFFQAEDGIRDAQESRGLGDVYKRQTLGTVLEGAFVLIGTIATLTYFHFGARIKPGQTAGRAIWIDRTAKVGEIFIGITLGALLAGVFSSSLVALVERVSTLVHVILQFFYP